jgi:hypothetical protein
MHDISIFKVINGQYKTDVLVATLEIEDVSQTTELDKFCQENDCYYKEDNDNTLFYNNTKQPKYWIR